MIRKKIALFKHFILKSIGLKKLSQINEMNNKNVLEGKIYRNGCSLFEGTLIINSKRVQLCCQPLTDNKDFFFYYYDNKSDESFYSAIQQYKKNRDKLYEMWVKMEKNPCSNCSYMIEDSLPTNLNIRTIHFPTGFDDSSCNFRCIYCNAIPVLDKKIKTVGNLFETIVKLSKDFDFKGMIFSFSTGEFVARNDANKILDYLYEKGALISLTSNSSIYKKRLMDFIKENRVTGINTSLDAGTRETFAKVKGVDCFNKVVENILKYSNEGCLYDLKYIILEGINDNIEDINGFVEIVKKANTRNATISANQQVKNKRLSENTINMTTLLYKKLKETNANLLFSSNDFNREDMKEIREKININ